MHIFCTFTVSKVEWIIETSLKRTFLCSLGQKIPEGRGLTEAVGLSCQG